MFLKFRMIPRPTEQLAQSGLRVGFWSAAIVFRSYSGLRRPSSPTNKAPKIQVWATEYHRLDEARESIGGIFGSTITTGPSEPARPHPARGLPGIPGCIKNRGPKCP